MEKEMIITLSDNTSYALLDETVIDEKKYFFAIKLDNETQNPTTEYEIFEQTEEKNETYMNSLEDGPLKEQIFIEFTNNYINSIKESE